MTWPFLLPAAASASLMFVVAALLLLRPLRTQRRFAARLLMSRGVGRAIVSDRPLGLPGMAARVIGGIGEILMQSGLLSQNFLSQFEIGLAALGIYDRGGIHLVLGSKICLLLGLPVIVGLSLQGAVARSSVLLMIVFAAGVCGLLLPDLVLRRRRKRYVKQVGHGLADALDLLVICSQAGLGLNAAIARVAEELQVYEPAIANELTITVNEIIYLADSRRALLNMGARTGVDGLVRLGTTLVQSMRYGTPLVESMRVLAAEIREATLTRFEARASRLGVLLTLPMVLFILPCVFLVVGGPAAIQAIRSFHAAQ